MTDDQHERLQAIRAKLSALGHESEMKELFGYIEELEKREEHYETFLAPELEGLTWTQQVRTKDANRQQDR